MSAPRYVECKCGHARALHPERLEEQCTSPDCDCEEYRPVTLDRWLPTPGVRLPRATDPAPLLPIADLIGDAKESGIKKLVARAEKVEALIADLRKLMKDSTAGRAIRDEIAALEATLAAKKAALRGGPTKPAASGGVFTCDTCGESFTSGQARGAHRRYKHPSVVSA